ncbi:MAG: glycosyltransferase family 39 protein [Rhodospirillaceae bacterium]|nr:glycosyltransferase family 39 protein [Rhodospirillaceae bacterium]MCA8931816.1 glycosyltransferase family 39 protein [Rhodospirillaceae bacterium]
MEDTQMAAGTVRAASRLLPIFIAAAVAVRFLYLGEEGLFLDEVYSVTLTSPDRSFSQFFQAYMGETHPPLYYIMLWGWFSIFPYNDLSARILNGVIGSGTLLFMYFYYRDLIEQRAYILLCVMFGCSYGAIYYAQEVRMYAPLLAGSVIAFGACLRAFRQTAAGETPGVATALLFFLGGALAAFSQYYGVLGISAMAAALLVVRLRCWRRLIPLLAATAVLDALVMAWMASTAAVASGSRVATWLEPDFEWVAMEFSRLLLSSKTFLYVVAAFVCLVAVLAYRRKDERREYLWFCLITLGCVLAVASAYTLILYPVLLPRALLVLFPAAYVLIAMAAVIACDLLGRHRRAGFLVCLALTLVLPLPRLYLHFSQLRKEDRPGSTAFVLDQAGCRDGTIFVVDDGPADFFGYYAGQIAPGNHMALFALPRSGQAAPEEVAAVLGDRCSVVAWAYALAPEELQALLIGATAQPLRFEEFRGVTVALEDDGAGG